MRRRFPRYLPVVAGALLLACGRQDNASSGEPYSGLIAFDSATVRLIGRDTVHLDVELAESDAQHTMGLMERQSLAQNAGMLFVYPTVQAESSAFWMFRTRIPLDIAFIDSAGTIRTVLTMQPCPSTLAQGCPNYPAGARYIAALETNSGFFAAHQLRVGDRILLADTVTRRRASRPTT